MVIFYGYVLNIVPKMLALLQKKRLRSKYDKTEWFNF